MIRTNASDKPFDVSEVNIRLTVGGRLAGEHVGGVPLDDIDLTGATEAEREALRKMALSAAVDQIERTFRPRDQKRTVIS